MKQANTQNSGINYCNTSTLNNMKNIFSTQYFKLLALVALSILSIESKAQIWVNPLTTGSPLGTYYKGDKINPSSTWYFNFEIGQASWNSSQVGVGKNTDGTTGWDYADATYYQDGTGSNKRVRRDLGQFQFTSTGTWYTVGRAKANAGDAYTYADETGWTDNQAFATTNASYWTVNDLQAPSGVSASVTSSTSVQVNFTAWLGRRVVIYRRTTATATPVLSDGTAYGSQNGSVGTLVYQGFGSSFSDTGLTPGQTYYYSVYSENYSYYSTGTTVSATPCTTPSATISGASSVCQGGSNQTITFTGSGGNANYTFTYKINGGSNQTVTSSGNTATVSVSSATVGTYVYSLVSVADANGCSQSQSGSATVTINPLPTSTITADGPTNICSGQTVGLSVPIATGATYLWNIGGSTNNAITVSSGGQYTCTVTLPTGCSSTSSPTNVTVNSNPTITVSASSLESTCGSEVTSTASGAGVGGSYVWSNGGNSATGSFTTAGTYTVTGTSAAGCTGTATVTVTNGSSTTSNAVAVHYYPQPTALIAGTTSVCQNETASITFTSSNTNAGPYTFTYTIDGGNNLTVTTTGSNLSTTVSVPTSTAGTYTYTLLSVADAHCSRTYSTGNTAVVTVNAAPTALTLTGSSYCANTSSGGTVVSGTSAIGVNYSLYNAGTIIDGTEQSGTGSALTWSAVTAGSAYTVIGINATTICSSVASNTVAVTTSATNGSVYYLDTDGDGYGTGTAVAGCSSTTPTGYAVNTGDCNNANSAIYPTATELCGNNIDENCSGPTDDSPSYYRTIADGNWGDASTWETACVAGITYTAAAYSPPSTYTGMVNIRNTHDVIIPANGTIYQTGTLDIDAGGSLTMTGNGYINDPTTATVAAGAKLTVTLTMINDGILNIGHQASFVQTATTAGTANTGGGVINVETKLTGASTAGAPTGRYWYIGSPMNNTSAGIFFNTQEMVRLWNYNAGNNSWGVVVHSTSNPTVTTSNKLVPGIGYLYRAGTNKTITYTGTPATLNNNIETNLLAPASDASYVTVTSYNTVGYKYVANPYPSHIDWPSVTRSGLNVSYWLRNSANTAYDAYNATTGISSSTSGQTTRYIAPMQGFWVYAFTANASLRVDNTDRVHSTNVLHTPVVNQVVRLKLNDGKSSDYTVVYENELASNDFEETDTDKMFDYDFHQLYTLEGEHELSLNGLSDATSKSFVEMGMVVPNNGPYTIEATDLGVEEAVILEDKFTGTFQDLRANGVYHFTSNAGTFNNRFILHFAPTESVAVDEAETVTDAVRVFNTSNKQVKVWVLDTENFQNATVKVYDAVGNIVERKNMTSNEMLLDMDIANGIYMVEVTGKNKTFTKKVFVTK